MTSLLLCTPPIPERLHPLPQATQQHYYDTMFWETLEVNHFNLSNNLCLISSVFRCARSDRKRSMINSISTISSSSCLPERGKMHTLIAVMGLIYIYGDKSPAFSLSRLFFQVPQSCPHTCRCAQPRPVVLIQVRQCA